jgi:hypothetical protein
MQLNKGYWEDLWGTKLAEQGYVVHPSNELEEIHYFKVVQYA